ncbi:MAG TPA: S1 RNA-binding domain-containing protein [Anaerolineales bacterium]|nr:S1 RNA-binding domain-containing protein [Anaerolineales bacterium]
MEEKTTQQVNRKDRFTGKVTRLTLGGAVIDLGLDRPGFLHLAHLKGDKVKRIEDALTVGQEIEVWVRNPGKDMVELTTSEPLALEWREIKKGMKVTGAVQKIEKFGAFVEIGAERPGLVHVSELSHDYVRSPEEVVKVGEQIEAVVLDVDRKKRQIRLSVKALSQKPEAIVNEINREAAEADDTPVPNAMEFALRAAMERSSGSEPAPAAKGKRGKRRDRSMEEIFARTLDNYKES